MCTIFLNCGGFPPLLCFIDHFYFWEAAELCSLKAYIYNLISDILLIIQKSDDGSASPPCFSPQLFICSSSSRLMPLLCQEWFHNNLYHFLQPFICPHPQQTESFFRVEVGMVTSLIPFKFHYECLTNMLWKSNQWMHIFWVLESLHTQGLSYFYFSKIYQQGWK